MKAVICDAFGPPDELAIREVAAPQPGPLDVQVAVAAAGVGYVDGLLVAGRYQVKPPLPYLPGSEFAGVVTGIGGEVEQFEPGDRVFGLASAGAFAETLCVRADQCAAVPPAMDDPTAAGFFINYLTALYGLRDCGGLAAGETLLVLGAAGGVGAAAIAVARALDARVVAAASTPEKRAAALRDGADAVIDYRQPDWRDELRALSADSGLQMVYDPVGGATAEPAFRSLSPGGRYLVVGFASGEIPRLPFNLPLLKRSALIGVDWGGAARADAGLNPPLLETLLAWFAEGRLIPARVAVRPFAAVREVLSEQLNGTTIGKQVLAGSWE